MAYRCERRLCRLPLVLHGEDGAFDVFHDHGMHPGPDGKPVRDLQRRGRNGCSEPLILVPGLDPAKS